MSQRLLQLDQVSFQLPDGRVLFEHLSHTFASKAAGSKNNESPRRARCAPDIQRMMMSAQCEVPAGKLLLQLCNVILPYGDSTPINLTLTGLARMAVIGANGSGKSTLL